MGIAKSQRSPHITGTSISLKHVIFSTDWKGSWSLTSSKKHLHQYFLLSCHVTTGCTYHQERFVSISILEKKQTNKDISAGQRWNLPFLCQWTSKARSCVQQNQIELLFMKTHSDPTTSEQMIITTFSRTCQFYWLQNYPIGICSLPSWILRYIAWAYHA